MDCCTSFSDNQEMLWISSMQSEKAKAHEVWDCVAEHSRISKTNLNFQPLSILLYQSNWSFHSYCILVATIEGRSGGKVVEEFMVQRRRSEINSGGGGGRMKTENKIGHFIFFRPPHPPNKQWKAASFSFLRRRRRVGPLGCNLHWCRQQKLRRIAFHSGVVGGGEGWGWVRIKMWNVPIHPARYVVSCFKQTSRRLVTVFFNQV